MYTHPLNGSLAEATAGAKAFHLGKLRQAGYPVPDGFVITHDAFEKFFCQRVQLPEDFTTEITTAIGRVGAPRYMVRSSAIGEDGQDASFAGQLDSFESGPTTEEIIEHITKCWASYRKANVSVYQNSKGIHLKGMAVVIQHLIQPDIAGVIFTRNPENESEMLVEYVEGHGAKLVSGEANPTRLTCQVNDVPKNGSWPAGLGEGMRLAKTLEQIYKAPLDIEWAIQREQFFLVQARPITTTARGHKIHWSNTNINENYPDPVTPLLYSLARDSYYHYFRELSKLFLITPEKIRELEGSYANVIGIFGCRMYYNMTSIHEIIAASPFSQTLAKSFNNFVGYTSENLKSQPASGSKLRFILKVLRFHRSLDKTVRTFETLANQYSSQADSVITFAQMKDAFHGFLEIRMKSWYRASLADFFAMLYHGLLGKFCRNFYGAESDGVHNKLIQAIPGLISSQPIIDMHTIKMALRDDESVYDKFITLSPTQFYNWLATTPGHEPIKQRIASYLTNWGFRCSGELMLTVKTYTEEPEQFIALLKQYDAMPDIDPALVIASRFEERKKVIAKFRQKIFSHYGLFFPAALMQIAVLNVLIALASKGIMARERVRLKQALIYFKFKQVVNKIGQGFHERGWIDNPADVLYLRYQEIAENLSSSDMMHDSLKQRINASRSEFERKRKEKYPDDFATRFGEYARPSNSTDNKNLKPTNVLRGLAVCGGQVRGRARILSSVLEASKLQQGDILITRQTDPGWIVVFPLISGLIVERGGMLSHGAIVSREFGIPAIVGVENVQDKIKDGAELLLNADTGEILIL